MLAGDGARPVARLCMKKNKIKRNKRRRREEEKVDVNLEKKREEFINSCYEKCQRIQA